MVRAPLPQLLPVVAIPVVGSAKDVYIDALPTVKRVTGLYFHRGLPGSVEVVAEGALL